MNILLSLSELQDYVARSFRQDITLKSVNERTIYVGTIINLPFISKNVGVNISILKVAGRDITLSYNNGLGVDLIIKGVLKFVKNTFPEYGQVVEERDGNTILLHLANIRQLEKPLEYVDLQDVRFTAEGVQLDVGLK